MRQWRSIPVAQKCSPKTEAIFPSYLVQKFVWTCLMLVFQPYRGTSIQEVHQVPKNCVSMQLIPISFLWGGCNAELVVLTATERRTVWFWSVMWGCYTQSANWQPLLVSVASFGMQMLLLSKTNLDASSHMCSKLPKLIISFLCIKWESHCI